MDYYLYECFTTFEEITHAFSPTIFPHLKIKFNFFIHSEDLNYVMNQDSATNPQRFGDLSISTHNTTADVTFRESLSYENIREKVGNAIGDHLLDDERRRVIERACKEVRERLPPDETLPKCTILHLYFTIKIEHWHCYFVASDYPRMVPAADSSLGMLEKYEADCVRDEERCCCICLEELAGGGGVSLRMPCSHVFHSGCIKEWLRTSHFCPLCRYEMPTE